MNTMQCNSGRKRLILALTLAIAIGTAVASSAARAEGGFSISIGNGAISFGNTVTGSGKVVEVARAVSAFERIEIEDSLRVTLRKANGGSEKLMIRADDNIEPLVESRVENGTLFLRLKPGTSLRTKRAIEATIDYRQLSNLAISDAVYASLDAATGKQFQASVKDGCELRIGDVSATDFALTVEDGSSANIATVSSAGEQRYRVADGARLSIEKSSGDRVAVQVEDGARASLRTLDAKSLDVKVSDGARFDVAGSAARQSYALSDSASVDALRLSGQSARVRASDGSSLKLGQVASLDADVNDGSSVRYSGEPNITQRVRDGSSLKRI